MFLSSAAIDKCLVVHKIWRRTELWARFVWLLYIQ